MTLFVTRREVGIADSIRVSKKITEGNLRNVIPKLPGSQVFLRGNCPRWEHHLLRRVIDALSHRVPEEGPDTQKLRKTSDGASEIPNDAKLCAALSTSQPLWAQRDQVSCFEWLKTTYRAGENFGWGQLWGGNFVRGKFRHTSSFGAGPSDAITLNTPNP